ncbi:MAG: carbohydrate ABC transporter permease [Thermus sp.]|nr:carbohydrate ABC transporter permease [Thermus sp.]
MRRRRNLALTYLLAAGYGLVLLLPLFTLVSASLRSEGDLYAPSLLPPRPTLEAYWEALGKFPIGRYLFNSLLVATLVTLGILLTSLLAAYTLTRFRFRGREVLFGLAIVLLLVPGEVTFLPLYLLVDRLGWLDTYWALVVPFAASPLGVFVLRQFLRTIPEEYFDAARVDGANHWQMLRHVALPLSLPALGALAALSFISTYNMYLWPLVVTRSTELRTAQIALNYILNEEVARWNVVAAAAILVLLPSLLAFLLAQRAFVRGISLGGLKG